MKRWGPLLLILIGLAAGLTGWWLYATIDPGPDASSDCRLHALYTQHVQISGAMSSCGGVTQQLYLSLALMAVGALLLVAGWLLTFTPRLRETATRTDTDPRFLATALLLLPVLIAGAGVFGWDRYQDGKERDHLRRAQVALAKLITPADLSTGGKECFTEASVRCWQSDKRPEELERELAALLHGTGQVSCNPTQPAVPCNVSVRGDIAGYPAMAFVQSRHYDCRTEAVPQGAIQLRLRKKASPFFYLYGSNVQIGLLTPDLR